MFLDVRKDTGFVRTKLVGTPKTVVFKYCKNKSEAMLIYFYGFCFRTSVCERKRL